MIGDDGNRWEMEKNTYRKAGMRAMATLVFRPWVVHVLCFGSDSGTSLTWLGTVRAARRKRR